MNIKQISIYDIKYYLKKHSRLYISFLILILVGVIFGIIIGLSSDGYLKLLNKENKLLFSIINGTFSSGSIFWKKLIQLFCPLIIIFVLNLNFYLGLLSYVIVAYQSGLLTLTIFAIVSTYGISGVLNVIFIILPINIVYIVIMAFFASGCIERSYGAMKNKKLGFNLKSSEFIFFLTISAMGVLLVSFVGVIILPFFLKNAIFVIF